MTIHTNNLPANDKDFIFITPYRSAQDGPAIYNLRGVREAHFKLDVF